MSHVGVRVPTLCGEGKGYPTSPLDLVREEPLSIRVQGRPYAVVMRTPGEETAHVAGFCLAEGIVDAPSDIETIASCEGEATNVATVTVTPSRREIVAGILERRSAPPYTHRGIRGKDLVEDLVRGARPFPDGPPVEAVGLVRCLQVMEEHQALYRSTRASHAAAVYTYGFELLSLAEDVGRHNALDKAVGSLFLRGILSRAGILVLSSRTSYEMVQKAARARIRVILAASRPTTLAVDLAEALNMTLAMPSGGSGLHVHCGRQRLASPTERTGRGDRGVREDDME